MTTSFNLEKYYREKNKVKSKNKLDITEKIKQNFETISKGTIKKRLKVEDVLNTRINFGKKYECNKEALKKLTSNINLIRTPKAGQCFFIDGNTAWVAQDPNDGTVRYFSRFAKSFEYFYLDIIDIYMLIEDKCFHEAVTELLSLYGIHTDEEERNKQSMMKYKDNISFLKNSFEWKQNYPTLYKKINRNLDILIEMNKIGLKNAVGDVCLSEGEAIFFASTRYIAQIVEKGRADNKTVSHNTIAKNINLFCLLGLITKMDIKKIPLKMRKRGEEAQKSKKWRTINYYTVKRITPELLADAEKMANEVWGKAINLQNITYNRIKKDIGVEAAARVYPNKVRNTLNEDFNKNEKNTKVGNASLDIISPEEFKNSPPF